MDRRKIILDCDPGQDDAIAILLAGRNPRLELLGITVVAGNQTLDKTLKNALHVTQHLGLEVPVYAGASRPLVRETQATAGEIHGESGLDGPVFAPLVKKAEEQHGVWYLIETLMASQGDITLVSCGPMTNIALAMRLEPKITSKIKELVFMGGAYGLGNVTPAAEFNFYCDPESARIVLNSGCPMTMMGLDLTAQALCTWETVQRMKKASNKAAELFCDTMSFYLEREGKQYGMQGGPLHDPACIAYLIDPACIKTKPMYVQVDTVQGMNYGRSVCDYYEVMKKKPNVNVAVTLDAPRFWDLVENGIRLYDEERER